MLEVNKINVFYDGLQVLWDVSFRVEKNEIVALIGSNGSGKTTTLKAISGLLPVQSGSIKFREENITNRPPHKVVECGVVYIPERRIFPRMKVIENLILAAYNKRAREKKKENLERVFQLFPILKDRRNQQAGTLSGGESQMLSIAMGLMMAPELLMLDEPSLGLAPQITLEIFKIIENIREEGVTILLVEQNVQHSLKIADRGYVLESGRVKLEGTGEELLNSAEIKRAYLAI